MKNHLRLTTAPRYTLVSAEERHAAAPATFEIPTRAERETVKLDHHVKLLFRDPEHGVERLWVRINGLLPDGRYLGALASQPLLLDLEPGEIIEFGPEHIASVFET